jgi:hypothetical protein
MATDAIWFYPGDILQVDKLGLIVFGLLLILAGTIFQLLRKQLAVTANGS